jgi:hypothetical protein
MAAATVLREFLIRSAKGADARHQAIQERRGSSGGALSAQPGCGVVRTSMAAAIVLRVFKIEATVLRKG